MISLRCVISFCALGLQTAFLRRVSEVLLALLLAYEARLEKEIHRNPVSSLFVRLLLSGRREEGKQRQREIFENFRRCERRRFS